LSKPLQNSGVFARISRAAAGVCERIEGRRRVRIRAARLLDPLREVRRGTAPKPLLWERVGRNGVQQDQKARRVFRVVRQGVWLTGFAVFAVGCSTPAKTDAAGPAAAATHETRDETPGVHRRIELRVKSEAARQRDSETGQGAADDGEGSEGGVGGSPACAPHPLTSSEAARQRGSEAGMPIAAMIAAAVLGNTGGQAASGTETPTNAAGIPAILRDAIDAARSQGLDVELVIDEYVPLAADTTHSTFTEQPARLTTSSEQAALGFSTKLRRFPLPWGGKASGGGFGFEATLLGGEGVNVLHVIGAGVMALAVIPLLRTPRRWSAALVFLGAGLAIVMAGTLVDEYPWVTLVAGVALLGLLAYGAYEAWRRGRVTVALDAITPVVEKHPMGEQLKGLIGDKAGRKLAAVKAETTASKQRAGA
jgi:hypothetical protein